MRALKKTFPHWRLVRACTNSRLEIDLPALRCQRRLLRSVAGQAARLLMPYFKDSNDSIIITTGTKLDHICRKLRLAPSDRFLDIGCGWGALIRWPAPALPGRCYWYYAERESVSICSSLHQGRRDLEARCRVHLLDYRDVPETSFDKIASVGMFEHVGRKNLPCCSARFSVCSSQAGSVHAFERGWLSMFQVLAIRPHQDGTAVYRSLVITSTR